MEYRHSNAYFVAVVQEPMVNIKMLLIFETPPRRVEHLTKKSNEKTKYINSESFTARISE